MSYAVRSEIYREMDRDANTTDPNRFCVRVWLMKMREGVAEKVAEFDLFDPVCNEIPHTLEDCIDQVALMTRDVMRGNEIRWFDL